MLISQYRLWTAKEKATANEREGAARTRKRCAFKDSVSYVPGFTTVSEKKNSQRRPCDFMSDLPPPHLSLTWFHKDLPLNGPYMVCVPSPRVEGING